MRALLLIALVIIGIGCKQPGKNPGTNNSGGGSTSGDQDGGTTDTASPPTNVTGVYLACSPLAAASNASSMNCVVAGQGDKQPVALQTVLNHWTFNYTATSSQPVDGVTVNVSSQANGFQLSAQGGTPDQQEKAISQAVVQMSYQTKDNQSSTVEYPVNTAKPWDGSTPPPPTLPPVATPPAVKPDSVPLNLAVTFAGATGGGIAVQQTIDPDATGVTFNMHGGPQVDQDHTYTSQVLFGASTLVVKNFWLSYDLAFDKAGKHCAGTVVFLLSSTQLTNNLACQ